MSNFWMGIAAAQNLSAENKSRGRRHPVLSVVLGIGLALLIGAGLFVMAAVNS
jgi:hypothetical protein